MRGSDRADSIQPSATLSITAKANELQNQGVDVVSFGAGEPDFPTPDPIKQAAIDAINQDFTKYTAASGDPELKTAVQTKLKRDQGLEYPLEQISTGCGAKHVLFNIMATTLNPGDEVLLFAPYWVSYPNQVRFFGAIPRVVDTSSTEFQPELDRVREATGPDTRLMILNSPSNPTGEVLPASLLRDLADFCRDNDILLVSDEIYEKLVYEGEHRSPAEFSGAIRDNTVIVNGVSKAYSMTGWRIGYAAGPEPLIQNMNKLMSHSTSNPASISQKAAIRALATPDEEIAHMVETFRERRDLMVRRLSDIPGVRCRKPGGAFYAFPDVSDLIASRPGVDSDMELADQMIEQAHVALVPGSPFGAPGYLRLSYANATERIELGLERFEEWATK